MRSLLVTGGAGFVGSGFVHHVLTHTDLVVTVLDKLTYAGRRENLTGLAENRVKLVVADVNDAEVVGSLVARHDAVVHFAAESHNDRSLEDPRVFVETNVVGTLTLLEAARRHGTRFHHVSTDEVFGDLALDDPARFTEERRYDPSSPYAASKAASDHLVRAWGRSFGLPVTLSGCSNTYGPRQHVEKLIPRQITSILDGGRPRVYGHGRHVRDWIHVDDHSAAVLAALERGEPGQTYLVGADGERSNLDIVRTILRLMDRDPDDLDLVDDRPGHDLRYATDATRLRETLGWRPRVVDLEAGLAETIEWYRTHESQWRGDKTATEAAYAATGH